MSRQRGFTLIELAVVLVIVTLLVGGLAVPLAAQIEARRVAETRRTLEEARDAIMGYAMTHPSPTPDRPYLPCPDTDGDGRENRTGDICSQGSGWLPWVDLGAAPHDAWGNRLLYSVETREYSDRSKGMPDLSLYSPPYPTLSLKRVCTTNACTALVADYLPVVIVSHGPNGWGARNVNGNTLAAPTGADELENTNVTPTFVSRPPGKASDPGGEFDDLVVWIADSVLRSRVCPAGGCP